MGKGDKKTRRGKLFSGSYGVLRPRKKKPGFSVVSPQKKLPQKKSGLPLKQLNLSQRKSKQKPVNRFEEANAEVKASSQS